jgi:hypothetical protein
VSRIPLRGLLVGAVAGAVGTAAMDLLWYARYRRGGGEDAPWAWETAEAVTGWEEASAPGQVGRKALALVTDHDPPGAWARTTTNVVHWAMGIGWGAQYGALAQLRPGDRLAVRALVLGPVVWASGYVVLPVLGVYKPIWEYDSRTLADDLSAHLVYGTTTAAAAALLGDR